MLAAKMKSIRETDPGSRVSWQQTINDLAALASAALRSGDRSGAEVIIHAIYAIGDLRATDTALGRSCANPAQPAKTSRKPPLNKVSAPAQAASTLPLRSLPKGQRTPIIALEQHPGLAT